MSRDDREENLKALSREDVLEQHDEQFDKHLEGDTQTAALFPGTRRRRFGMREASSTGGPGVIPGGTGHPQGIPAYPDPLPGEHNYPVPEAVTHVELDVGAAKPYYHGGLAHGVENTPHFGGRIAPEDTDRTAYEASDEALPEDPDFPLTPIPVVIVAGHEGMHPDELAEFKRISVPAAGADPVTLIKADPSRTRVQVLNESATAVRFNSRPVTQPTVAPGDGALIPASMTSYLKINAQSEIWATCEPGTSSPASISIILEYSREAR
jgi:hypothetical protein